MAQMTWTSQSYKQPDWQAEQLTPERLLPGGARLVASAFPKEDAQTITLAAGVVTAGSSKTLTLTTALTYPIPLGYTIDFGSGEFFTLTTAAAAGATTLVGTLAADIEGGETASLVGTSSKVVVPSGTLVGRTFTERDAGTGYGPADVSTPDDQIFLTAFEVINAEINPDCTLIRHGTLIYEDKLPGWATSSSSFKAIVRARYHCIKASA